MTLVALPLVPDAPVPWLADVNPHKVWTLAILLAGVSFLGYLGVKRDTVGSTPKAKDNNDPVIAPATPAGAARAAKAARSVVSKKAVR